MPPFDGESSGAATASANAEVATGAASDGTQRLVVAAPQGRRGRVRDGVGALADRPLLVDLIAITVLALVLRAIFPHAEPDTDPTFALIWGREILNGHLPDFAYSVGPTAHPLPTLEASLAGLLGARGAVDAWMVLSYWSLGAMLWGVFRLGEAAFSRATAALAVVLVVTNYATLNVGLGGFLDVQFLAVVVWAAVLELRRPRRGMAVLVLLALAGLLRPEAEILAAACWLYAFYRRDHWLAGALIVCVAPVAWVLMDLIVTGHPLFAFTNARHSGAGQALSGAGGGQLVSTAVDELRNAMRAPILLGGALGVALSLRLRVRGALVPGAITAIVLIVYAILLVLRLPVPDRMLLTPAVMLSLFCAFLAVGWIDRRSSELRRLWTVVGAAAIVLLLVTGPDELSRLQNVENRRAELQQVITDLQALNRLPAARTAFASCRAIWVGRAEMTQYASYYLDRPLEEVGVDAALTPEAGVYLTLRTGNAAIAVLSHWESQRGLTAPAGDHPLAQNRSWAVYTNGC